MSWDDWDDDEPRPRRGRRGDFDLHRDASHQSGAVTGVGVVTITMGILIMLGGGCHCFCGVAFTGLGQVARQEGNVLPPGMFEVTGGIFLGLSLLYLLLGLGNLVGGIGTLHRRHWARVVTLWLGGASGLLGLGYLGLIILIWTQGGGLFGAVDDEGMIVQSLVLGFVALIFLAHLIFVYIVLLNSHNKEEFD